VLRVGTNLAICTALSSWRWSLRGASRYGSAGNHPARADRRTGIDPVALPATFTLPPHLAPDPRHTGCFADASFAVDERIDGCVVRRQDRHADMKRADGCRCSRDAGVDAAHALVLAALALRCGEDPVDTAFAPREG